MKCLKLNCLFFVVFYLKISFMLLIKIKNNEIHIGAVFPMSGDWPGGTSCRPAALMALDDVNNQTEILPNYHLTMTMGDSQCIPGLGAKMMYELLYKPPVKIIFLTGCSTVTTFVAQAAPRWNLIVVAYGSSSPALSNRARFPSFFRTHPSASLQNPTRLKLIKRLGWKKISIIWEMEEVFISTVQDLEKMAKEQNVTIIKRQSFQKQTQSVFLAVKALLNEDARVIVGLFYEKFARKVFCEAYHQGLHGKKIVWIIIGWYADDWWKSSLEQDNINCTVAQMKAAVEGHLTTESLMWNNDDKDTVSGLTSLQFKLRLVEKLKESMTLGQFSGNNLNELTKIPGYPEAPLAYDAIWAIAIALDKTERRLKPMGLSLTDFKYQENPNVIYEQLHKAMNETNFMGVSTLVYFDSSGSRISWTRIEQMIDGSYHLIGYYHYETDNLTLVTEPIWKNGKIPRDSIEVVYRRQVLSLAVYISICCLVIMCAICASICVVIFRRNNQPQTIYDSLKIVCCTGCIISLCGVILLGIDRTRIIEVTSNYIFTGYCQIKVGTVSLGFNLGYGSLFLSIWLVYRTATKRKKLTTMQTLRHLRDSSKEQSVQTQSDRNKQTSTTIENKSCEVRCALIIFCFLDFVVLVIWQYFDPMLRTKSEFPKEIDALDEDIHYYPYIEICECTNLSLWLGIIYGWKGLLLIVGILLAYETRNTRMSKSEDIRTTCMAIYNVVIVALITGPVSIMISNQQTAHFAFVSISILVCCSLSMGLIFVPKIIRQRKGIRDQDNVVLSDIETVEVSQDEETSRQRLKSENEELKMKISKIEKEIEKLHAQLPAENHNINNKTKINQRVVTVATSLESNTSQTYNRKQQGSYQEDSYHKGKTTPHNSGTMNIDGTGVEVNDKHLDGELSLYMDNTSGIYSDIVGAVHFNYVTKY